MHLDDRLDVLLCSQGLSSCLKAAQSIQAARPAALRATFDAASIEAAAQVVEPDDDRVPAPKALRVATSIIETPLELFACLLSCHFFVAFLVFTCAFRV